MMLVSNRFFNEDFNLDLAEMVTRPWRFYMAPDDIQLQPITGFPEWTPGERLLELSFIDTIRRIFERYGYAPIETPAIERNSTLESKGEINKQVYSLYRPNVPEGVEKDTALSLHFDLTVPLARYVAQHYSDLVFPFRRYQMQKVWRGERAQRGRFREFMQCDIDIIGENELDLLADAEMPSIVYEVFKALNIGRFVIRISNRKILQGLLAHYNITGEQAEETLRGIDRLPKLKGGWPELVGWLTSQLGIPADLIDILECALSTRGTGLETLKQVSALSVPNDTFLLGIQELKQVLEYTHILGVPENIIEIDPSITRGLDYYTGTVYETFLLDYESALGSICSGGRYDNLASHFSDRVLPGVGLSIGLTRLFAGLLEMGKIQPISQTPVEVMVTVPDRKYLLEALSIAADLRHSDLDVELYIQDSRHDRQLKSAVRKGISFAVIPWPERLCEQDSVEIRNLQNGEREIVLRHEVASVIRFVLEKWGRIKKT
jgi:histidyl-tRNA synthetase